MLAMLTSPGSYLGIIIFLILTGCGMPLPEEIAIIAAGVLSAQGVLNPWTALAACVFGAVLGDCIMYGIGHRFGHGLLKDHPRFARILHAEREERFEAMIQKHGFKVLFFARFMVGIRSPVYLAAGVLRMPFRRFFLFDVFSATAVVATFFLVAFWFGEPIAAWIRQAELWLTVVVLSVLTIVGIALYVRARRRLTQLAENVAQTDSQPETANEPAAREQEQSVA